MSWTRSPGRRRATAAGLPDFANCYSIVAVPVAPIAIAVAIGWRFAVAAVANCLQCEWKCVDSLAFPMEGQIGRIFGR